MTSRVATDAYCRAMLQRFEDHGDELDTRLGTAEGRESLAKLMSLIAVSSSQETKGKWATLLAKRITETGGDWMDLIGGWFVVLDGEDPEPEAKTSSRSRPPRKPKVDPEANGHDDQAVAFAT